MSSGNFCNLIEKCEYVAPGKLGFCCPEMLKIETLRRPKLGEPFNRGRPKQPKDFVYGIKYKHNPNEIVECLTWLDKAKTSYANLCPIDYEKINVESTKVGVHKVPDWMEFKHKHPYRVPYEKKFHVYKSNIPKDMVFGILRKDPANISCLVSHGYKSDWDEHALEYVCLKIDVHVKFLLSRI